MAIAIDVYKVCVCMYVYMFVCKYCVDSSRVSVTVQSSAGAIQSTVKTLVQSCALEVRQSPCHTVTMVTQSQCHTVIMSHSHHVHTITMSHSHHVTHDLKLYTSHLTDSCALEVRQSPCHTVMSHSHNITQSSCHTVTMSHSHNVTRSPCHT